MAAVHHSPIPTEIEDPVTYAEASALLKPTGHPASAGTIARWVREANSMKETIPVVRCGKADYVPWTLIVREHHRRTAVKLRASSNWP